MPAKRKIANLTALAVLSVLTHRPMHPYEMAGAMRGWGKDRDMQVKWGSLYSIVGRMEQHGLIEAAGTSREGNRPERTVYRITEAGLAELADWARELLATADGDPNRFHAGLSVMAVLPPDEAAALLRERLAAMEERLAADEAQLEAAAPDVPRLFMLEGEYAIALARTEIEWVRSLLDEIEHESDPYVAQWREYHRDKEMPEHLRDLAERRIDP